MNPKISVLMTVYNGEKYLAEAIDSVLNQTFRNFELIIVNDGSTDKTKGLIKMYMKKDKRIVYLEEKENKGFGNWHNILNKGLSKAKGKYIARLDADDICYKERLNIQFDYLEKNSDIFILGSSADVIDKLGKKVGEMIKKPWPPFFLKLFMVFNNPFIHSSIMFRNKGLKYPSNDERLFYFSMLMRGYKLFNLKKKLIKYRINPEGMMAKYTNVKEGKYGEFYLQK